MYMYRYVYYETLLIRLNERSYFHCMYVYMPIYFLCRENRIFSTSLKMLMYMYRYVYYETLLITLNERDYFHCMWISKNVDIRCEVPFESWKMDFWRFFRSPTFEKVVPNASFTKPLWLKINLWVITFLGHNFVYIWPVSTGLVRFESAEQDLFIDASFVENGGT